MRLMEGTGHLKEFARYFQCLPINMPRDYKFYLQKDTLELKLGLELLDETGRELHELMSFRRVNKETIKTEINELERSKRKNPRRFWFR